MARVRVRTRSLNGNDVVLQRKRRFFPEKWDMSWVDWASMSNRKHQIEGDIVKTIDKLKSLLDDYAAEDESLQAEIDDIKNSTSQTMGYGVPFWMKTDGFFITKVKQVPPPAGHKDWHEFINPSYLKRHSILRGMGTGSRKSKKGRKGQGGSTSYTLEDQSELGSNAIKELHGTDSDMKFRPPQPPRNRRKGKGQQGSNNQQGNQED